MSIELPTRDRKPALSPVIDARQRRGREARDKDKNIRELCRKFWKGDQYHFMTPAGGLSYQVSGGAGIVAGGKPINRIRNTYNYVQMIVEGKVSAATQQIPGYEVTPSTDDPEDEAAASLGTQVAIYGYDKWRVRRATTKAITDALVAREGFVMPYFDPNVGPFVIDPETGKATGRGEIRLKTFSREQVFWEKDTDFDDSPWYGIDQEMRVEDIRRLPGFIEGSLEDARKRFFDRAGSQPESLTVTEYLERPCPEYPLGRRIFSAQGRVIVDYRQTEDGDGSPDWWEPYPCVDAEGVVMDEPVLHRISYTVNPDGDDLGLVERIIDLQRTVNDTWNKILEIKNRALLLQMIVPKGANMPRRDDTPGATYEVNMSLGKPEWEPAPDPGLLNQLLQIHREAISELRTLSADVDIQAQPRLAEGTAQLAQSAAQGRWASFLGDLAEFHSRLMRHCLTLVARYYDEQRQIDIRGQYGWQPMSAFSGQDLRSQVNVRVLPGSLATKSRQAIQAEIQFIQANWPGAISPEAALSTLHGGSAEGLLRSYQNDVAKAWRIVRRLQQGPEAMESFPSRFDPTLPNPNYMGADPLTGEIIINPHTGRQEPQFGVDVPGWMPGPQDNIQIWRQVIGDYMKTEDFERRDQSVQECFRLIWDGLESAEQQRAAKQAAQQQMQAESLGMGNAAKRPLPPPTPDTAGFNPDTNQAPVEAPA